MKKRYKSTFANVIIVIYIALVTIRFPVCWILGGELDEFGAYMLTMPWSLWLDDMLRHIEGGSRVPDLPVIFVGMVINAYIIRFICKILDL